MNDDMRERFNNPSPIETAPFQLETEEFVMEIHRAMSDAAVIQRELFQVLGDKAGVEWRCPDGRCVLYKHTWFMKLSPAFLNNNSRTLMHRRQRMRSPRVSVPMSHQ